MMAGFWKRILGQIQQNLRGRSMPLRQIRVGAKPIRPF